MLGGVRQAQNNPALAGSYLVAQAEGTSAEEELGPNGRLLSFQENLYARLH